MKDSLNIYFDLAFKIALTIVILTTLFLFSNLTTDFYETPKFLVLLAFSGISLLLLTLKFTLENKVVLVRTPLDIPLLLLLVVAVVSTIMSPSSFVSLLGLAGKPHGGLVATAVYIIFYFCLVNNLKSGKDVKNLTLILTGAGVILSLISLISFAGVKILPAPFMQSLNFTPTGSNFSTTAVLALILPLCAIRIFGSSALIPRILNTLVVTLFGVVIALTGSLPTWIAAIVGFLVTFFALHRGKNLHQISINVLAAGVFPVVIVGLVFALSYLPPLGNAQNPIYTQAKNFPRELQIPFMTSWKTSVSAFRDSPFWGSGPATYLFNFTNYKPIEFNSLQFWNVRFDSAFNEYLGVLATLGGIGLIALLSVMAMFLSSFTKAIHSSDPQKVSLAIAGLVFFVILIFHSSTLVVWVIGLAILASFFVTNLTQESTIRDYSNLANLLRRIATPTEGSRETIRIDTLPAILLVISTAAVLFAFFFEGKFALANYHHKKAVGAVAKSDGLTAYNTLIAAEKLNPYNDLYRTDLAQVNFALANAIASAKGPTESSPSGSFTDQDKQNIQTLLQQAISEARTAVTLSPRSAGNWEILALIYRQIAGVANNALAFSLDAYGRAIFQDPLNPILRVNVGGVYYATKNYDLAIRFFTDAINLKPDYANGYYNLSVALRDKGDLNTALVAAEKTLELVEENSNDYQIAKDYLNDLKSKGAGNSPSQPPAAQTEGALKEEGLPKVVNVGNPPEKIATPSAVRRPNSTPEPSPRP